MNVEVVQTPVPEVVYVVERGGQGLSAAAAWLIAQNNPALTEEDFYRYIASLVPVNGGGGGSQSLLIRSFPAAVVVSGHSAVTVSNGQVRPLDLTQLLQADTCVGLATGSAQPGALVDVCLSGYIQEFSWNWRPGPVFAGINGTLTQTPPRVAFEQRVGLAAGPTAILVDVEPSYVYSQ